MSYSIHKQLSVKTANAQGCAEVGHGDIGLIELRQAIEKYDDTIATSDKQRHAPTYARATATLFDLERQLEV